MLHNWTQQIFKEKNRFQNPLRQNYKHVKTLESLLEIPPEAIISVVAFTGACTLKTDMPPNVTRGLGFVDYIKSHRSPILSQSQVHSVADQISSGRLAPSRKTDKEHVQKLKAHHEAVPDKLCSKCGKAMVLRTAKKGASSGEKFWGCSGYPSCRTIQKIT